MTEVVHSSASIRNQNVSTFKIEIQTTYFVVNSDTLLAILKPINDDLTMD